MSKLGGHKGKGSTGGRVSGTLLVDWRQTHMVEGRSQIGGWEALDRFLERVTGKDTQGS